MFLAIHLLGFLVIPLSPFDSMGLDLVNSTTLRNLHFAPFPSLIIEVIHEVVVGIKKKNKTPGICHVYNVCVQ